MYKHLYDSFKHWYCTDGAHQNAIWIFSDPHFNDSEMTYLRKNYIGDEEQVKCLNKKIGKHDTVICLGDVGDINFVKKLRGYKVLIMGNHEKGASNYKRVIEHVTKCPKCGNTKLNSLGNNDGMSLYRTQCDKCGFIGDTFGPDFDCVEDNRLFDEVYEGPLMISDKIILSHEPLNVILSVDKENVVYNIHGHDHSLLGANDDYHLNVCVEHINYTPVSLKDIVESGALKNIPTVHRQTINKAITRKALHINN